MNVERKGVLSSEKIGCGEGASMGRSVLYRRPGTSYRSRERIEDDVDAEGKWGGEESETGGKSSLDAREGDLRRVVLTQKSSTRRTGAIARLLRIRGCVAHVGLFMP